MGLELEACRISKKAAEVGECKPQTTSSQPHKQDGVLTGSPFPKVIEEESLGGQRRLNFLYLLPSEFATNLTSRELFPRVPPLQRRPVRIRRLRDLDTCSYKHRELSVPDAASATLHCVPSFCRPRELGGQQQEMRGPCYITSVLSCIPHKGTLIPESSTFQGC